MPLTIENMRNFTGYMQMSMVKINNLLKTIEKPNTPTSEKAQLKDDIKEECKKIVKMMNTVAMKEGYTITVTPYTDEELTSMNCM